MLELVGRSTQQFTKIDQKTRIEIWTNLYVEPHDYQIYYVSIDLCHQNGISVAESQTFLDLCEMSPATKSEVKQMFSQANFN